MEPFYRASVTLLMMASNIKVSGFYAKLSGAGAICLFGSLFFFSSCMSQSYLAKQGSEAGKRALAVQALIVPSLIAAPVEQEESESKNSLALASDSESGSGFAIALSGDDLVSAQGEK